MKIKFLLCAAAVILPVSASYAAETAESTVKNIVKNNARMQAMDKITGRVSIINVPVGGEVKFGSLSIVVRSCQTRPEEETPDNFAFADIADKNFKGEKYNIFKGWMISSSPATHAVEHPIYDVWLLRCTNEKIDKNLLLTEEQLEAHDNLPKEPSQAASDGKDAPLTDSIRELENKEPEKQEESEEKAAENTEFSYDEEDQAETDGEADEHSAVSATGISSEPAAADTSVFYTE